MDISNSIASAATGMAEARLKSSVQMSVLKKAMDMQSQGALQLLQSVVQSSKPANPAHLGNTLDVTA